MLKWLSISWYIYLFEKPFHSRNWSTRFSRLVCRVNGHPGPVWTNMNGLEPDMHCKNCGEEL
jgi:hypothetical protein